VVARHTKSHRQPATSRTGHVSSPDSGDDQPGSRTRLIEEASPRAQRKGSRHPLAQWETGADIPTILKAAGRALARVTRQMNKVGGWQGTSRAHEHASLWEMTRISETKLLQVSVCTKQSSQVSGGGYLLPLEVESGLS
jgi:hypothetical protein